MATVTRTLGTCAAQAAGAGSSGVRGPVPVVHFWQQSSCRWVLWGLSMISTGAAELATQFMPLVEVEGFLKGPRSLVGRVESEQRVPPNSLENLTSLWGFF